MPVPGPTTPARLVGALALIALMLTACGSASSTGTAPAAPVTASDAWVKAVDGGMTAAFMTLSNNTSTAVTLVSAAAPVAGMVEIHEMAMVDGAMVMQPKEGGIVVPAGGQATLEPGGDHIMLMELTGPVAVGDDVSLTLTLSDGSTLAVTAVAKDFDGGNESYQPSPSASMSMG